MIVRNMINPLFNFNLMEEASTGNGIRPNIGQRAPAHATPIAHAHSSSNKLIHKDNNSKQDVDIMMPLTPANTASVIPASPVSASTSPSSSPLAAAASSDKAASSSLAFAVRSMARLPQLSRYIPHKLVMESLFGWVIVAKDTHSGLDVCMKISRRDLCVRGKSVRGDGVCDDVHREAAMLAYISQYKQSHHAHPHRRCPYHDEGGGIDEQESYQAMADDATPTTDDEQTDSPRSIGNGNGSNGCRPSFIRSSSSSSLSEYDGSDSGSPSSSSIAASPLASSAQHQQQPGAKHVLGLVDKVSDKHFHYLVTEYLPLGDLFDALVRNGAPLKPELARHIFRQVALGVQFLHKQRHVAHNDLSLENLCVSADGDIKLIDLGSAALHPFSPHAKRSPSAFRLLSEHAPAVSLCPKAALSSSPDTSFPVVLSPSRRLHQPSPKPGKKAYMPLELYAITATPYNFQQSLSNASVFTQVWDAYASDMWSLGIILYTLLTSHPPFETPDVRTDAWCRYIVSGRWLHPQAMTKPNSQVYAVLANQIDRVGDINYSHRDALSLVDALLKPQHMRINIDQVLNHEWMRRWSDSDSISMPQLLHNIRLTAPCLSDLPKDAQLQLQSDREQVLEVVMTSPSNSSSADSVFSCSYPSPCVCPQAPKKSKLLVNASDQDREESKSCTSSPSSTSRNLSPLPFH